MSSPRSLSSSLVPRDRSTPGRLGREFRTGWSLTVYPGAGEAGGCFVSSRERAGGTGVRGQARDPERSRLEAGRRARATLRRYCAANGLNRLGTLTYAGEGVHDPAVVKADVAAFFTRLRALRGGDRVPYVWVAEWHKTGHGLHLHFAVGEFIPRGLIEQAWGHGFVHIKRLGGPPVGSGAWRASV